MKKNSKDVTRHIRFIGCGNLFFGHHCSLIALPPPTPFNFFHGGETRNI
jgi:hypothetical protein